MSLGLQLDAGIERQSDKGEQGAGHHGVCVVLCRHLWWILNMIKTAERAREHPPFTLSVRLKPL